MKNIKVSILCLSYNHKNFIRQALDSILSQKVNFDYEIIIHDDASTDGSANIIKEYCANYPDKFVPILQEKNQWSQGKYPLTEFMIEKIRGKYVIVNECDDYFTDNLKLQKQVDYLDNNLDCTICFHPVSVKYEGSERKNGLIPSEDFISKITTHSLSFENLLKGNFLQTNSVLYRWSLTYDEWPKKQFLPCDYFLHLIHASKGEIGFINEVMSVYRKHNSGIWWNNQSDESWINIGLQRIRFWEAMEKSFHKDYTSKIQIATNKTVEVLFKYKRFTQLNELIKEFPFYFYNSNFVKRNFCAKLSELTPYELSKLSDKLNESNSLILSYRAHISKIGWINYLSEKGEVGCCDTYMRTKSNHIESINISTSNIKFKLKYKVKIKNNGWSPLVDEGKDAGTTGKSLPLQGFVLYLDNEKYLIKYRVFWSNHTATEWVNDGTIIESDVLDIIGIQFSVESK